MVKNKEKRDKHFPLVGHVISRLFDPPKEFFNSYITKGRIVADLGCGPGYYSLHFAEILGPEGMVYAVDSDEKCIKVLEKKTGKHGYKNIEAHTSSASNLSFIGDDSIDFIFANGLLCSMAPHFHESAVKEIKRILKPDGLAYLSVARGSYSYMEDEAWDKILEGFRIRQRTDKRSSRSAELSLK